MKLMIVESPNKIKKIKAILGSSWDVAASVGHIRDLPVKSLGIEPNTYRLEYQILERSESVVAQLRKRAARSEQVYLATDPDREGEAIAWHLEQVLSLRRYARVTFDAITEKVVRAAIESPRQLNFNLVHAQEARRGADRLVGYQVSPALSRQTGIARLSAGRVQSVALRLVVDRQREMLDDIAEGKAQHLNMVSSIDGQLKKELTQMHIASQPALASNGSAPAKTGNAPPHGSLLCPKCEQGAIKKPNGQIFYGCSRYREGCNFSINETIAKKTLTPKQVETLCTKGKTALLKGFTSKQGKPFEAYLTLSKETDWKAQFRFESGR